MSATTDPGRGVLVGVGDHTGLVATVPDVGSRDDLDSDARPEAGPDRTESRSFIDVRVGDDPATAGHESPIAHHYDFGLRDRYDLAVSTSPGPAMRNAGAAAFRIEISNEGSLPSGPIEVRADLPAATSLHPTRGASIAPTSIDAGSITWAFDDLASIAPGDVRVIDLELRVNDPSLTSITNSVQIVRDSGRDEDSDPGLTWGQDDEDELTIDLYGIDGTVWVDVASDETERVQSGAGGVVVVVLDADGARVGGTTTDEAGRFLFDSLPVGRYRIAIPASEFGSGRPLNGYDQAVGAGSANVTRALDRDGFVSSEPFELGGTTPPRSPTIDLGLVRRPPTPLVDIVVQMVLGPSALLCIAALVLQRRRHLGGSAPAGPSRLSGGQVDKPQVGCQGRRRWPSVPLTRTARSSSHTVQLAVRVEDPKRRPSVSVVWCPAKAPSARRRVRAETAQRRRSPPISRRSADTRSASGAGSAAGVVATSSLGTPPLSGPGSSNTERVASSAGPVELHTLDSFRVATRPGTVRSVPLDET